MKMGGKDIGIRELKFVAKTQFLFRVKFEKLNKNYNIKFKDQTSKFYKTFFLNFNVSGYFVLICKIV